MLHLYQLECRVVARDSDLDAALRRRQHLEQARTVPQRAVHAFRSALRRPTIAWPAPRRADGGAA